MNPYFLLLEPTEDVDGPADVLGNVATTLGWISFFGTKQIVVYARRGIASVSLGLQQLETNSLK